jgi:hypothetical protein
MPISYASVPREPEILSGLAVLLLALSELLGLHQFLMPGAGIRLALKDERPQFVFLSRGTYGFS